MAENLWDALSGPTTTYADVMGAQPGPSLSLANPPSEAEILQTAIEKQQRNIPLTPVEKRVLDLTAGVPTVAQVDPFAGLRPQKAQPLTPQRAVLAVNMGNPRIEGADALLRQGTFPDSNRNIRRMEEPPPQQLDLVGIANAAKGGPVTGYNIVKTPYDAQKRMDALAKAYDPLAALSAPETKVFDAEREYGKLMPKDKAKRRGYDELADTDKFNLGAQLALGGLRQMGSKKNAMEALADSLDPTFRNFTAAQQRAYEEDMREIAEKKAEAREILGFRRKYSDDMTAAERKKYDDRVAQLERGIKRTENEIRVMDTADASKRADNVMETERNKFFANARNESERQAAAIRARGMYEQQVARLKAQYPTANQKDLERIALESFAKAYGTDAAKAAMEGNMTLDKGMLSMFTPVGVVK